MESLIVLAIAVAIVGGFGVVVGLTRPAGATRDNDVARRRRELDAAAGRRRVTAVRAFLPNDGNDGDAA